MADSPISDQSRELAERFVSTALHHIEDSPYIENAFKIGEDLQVIARDFPDAWLGDVANDIWRFGVVRAVSLERHRDMPFVQIGEAGDIPVLQDSMFRFPMMPFEPFWRRSFGFTEDWLASMNLKFRRIDPKNAVSIFAKLLLPFVGRRFQSGLHHGSGGGIRPPVGGSARLTGSNGNYLVELTSRQTNWYTYKSPAYGMHFTYFGAPTYPVFGYLSGGHYIFAGTPPAGSGWVTDTTVFVIPDTLTPHVSAF